MARLRQQYPHNYGSSGNISTEIESVVRYLNAAELGNNTIGELLSILFDSEGVWQGPISMRTDSAAGIQYRVGEYTDPELGWVTLIALEDIRGEAGTNTGTLGAPIFFGRVDTTATTGQTLLDYSFADTDELLVWKDGVLLRKDTLTVLHDYSTASTGGSTNSGELKFNAALTTSNVITVAKVRTTAITGYVRKDDDVISATQQNFSFVFDENTTLHVYKNGIFQREGGTNDYTLVPTSNIVQFNAASAPVLNDVVTILTVQNTTNQAVTGLMLEEAFVNSATGKISFSSLGIDDGDIPQAKVSGLAADIASSANITIDASAPATPLTGALWQDTSVTPNKLNFYDGTAWIPTSPTSSLPAVQVVDAGRLVQVDSLGASLIYADPDYTTLVKQSQIGNATNGVAPIDSNLKVPLNNLPTALSTGSKFLFMEGSVAPVPSTGSARTLFFSRHVDERIIITSLYANCSSGSCVVEIYVNSNALPAGAAYTVNSTTEWNTISNSIALDSRLSNGSDKIEIMVTVMNGVTNLDLAIGYKVLPPE
jgi:hypothetical protein